ncbi:MAG: Dolichyl-phosphate-mannose-protein mannosyltransferase [Nocardioides sp.]|nr:Dolichyl-phosphate-mannose-protein mannosyltransferase [Nocardioides sp.]
MPTVNADRAAIRRRGVQESLRDRVWQARITLGVILLVAAALRVIGSRFGFPLLVHPDEKAIVDGVIDMARRNSFEPPWSLRPDHVEMKVDYLAFTAYAGPFRGMSVESAFAADPVPFYWIARLMTAAFGVATVVLAYLVGRRSSRRAGLVAATLFALFPAFVRDAHYATPDVPLTFALMLMIYALMRYLGSASWGSLLWASFAVALAIAIKYPGAVGAVAVGVVVVVASVRDRAWRRMVTHALGSAAALIGFLFLISPVLFTNFVNVRHELDVQSRGGRLANSDFGAIGNMWYYATLYADTAGLLLLLLAAVGMVVVVARRRLEAIPWFTGVLVWVSLSTLPMTWERWGLPMWVTPLLLAAAGFDYLLERLTSQRLRWIPLAGGTVVLLQLAASSLAVVAGLLAPDTRLASLAFADSRGIQPRESIFEGYTPFLPGTFRLFFEQVRKDGDGYALLTSQGKPASYVVLSSGMYERVMADPAYPEGQRIYRWILDNGQQVRQFQPVAEAEPTALEPLSIVRNFQLIRDLAAGGMTGPVIKFLAVPVSSASEAARPQHE